MYRIEKDLEILTAQSNFRQLPKVNHAEISDFSSNDYLGIGTDVKMQHDFFNSTDKLPSLTSSASRLLAHDQEEYYALENLLEQLYSAPALLFNSGYHANTGLISALADKKTLIVADKLVHASIIDGYKLSEAEMVRFRHNDLNHLEKILKSKAGDYDRVLIAVEGVYSMDGDTAPLKEIVEIKKRFGNSLLYVDEAHSFGVAGDRGLGLVADLPLAESVDILVGTFGKAAASVGAFAIMGNNLKNYAVNRSRSLIFSTAIPPLNCAWTRYVVERIPEMTDRRKHLAEVINAFVSHIDPEKVRIPTPSHIIPVIVGDSQKALKFSDKLAEDGLKVLPIRTPTVPAGSERLRVSLSAALSQNEAVRLAESLNRLL